MVAALCMWFLLVVKVVMCVVVVCSQLSKLQMTGKLAGEGGGGGVVGLWSRTYLLQDVVVSQVLCCKRCS